MNVHAPAAAAAVATASTDTDLLGAIDKLAKEGSIWGRQVTIDQRTVDIFTALTGDANKIHKADHVEDPIVPGLLTLALLPLLSPFSDMPTIAGYKVLNAGVACDFKRPVPVGQQLCMKFKPRNPLHDRLGINVTVDFQIGVTPFMKIVAFGYIKLLLVD